MYYSQAELQVIKNNLKKCVYCVYLGEPNCIAAVTDFGTVYGAELYQKKKPSRIQSNKTLLIHSSNKFDVTNLSPSILPLIHWFISCCKSECPLEIISGIECKSPSIGIRFESSSKSYTNRTVKHKLNRTYS